MYIHEAMLPMGRCDEIERNKNDRKSMADNFNVSMCVFKEK